MVNPVSIEAKNSLFQGIRRIFLCQGWGDNPQTELLAFQSSFAVGDQCFEEIRLRLVEETKVRTPRHVAHNVDSRPPHLTCHSRYLLAFRDAWYCFSESTEGGSPDNAAVTASQFSTSRVGGFSS